LVPPPALGLGFEEGSPGALVEPGGGGPGARLPGVGGEVESGAVAAEGAAGVDLAPLGREVTEFLELLSGELASRPGACRLGVRVKGPKGFA
jgi:hypothetical protein